MWNSFFFLKNNALVLVPRVIKNTEKGRKEAVPGEYVLVEDYLSKFEKFNSNTMTVKKWTSKSIQAFCHWTYHESRGKLLVCDAQGADNKSEYVLTDPVIVSDARIWSKKYGPGDGGREMMKEWFRNHECNKHCSPKWRKAAFDLSSHRLLEPTMTTSYVSRVLG